jgi:hypothetical protein
MTSGRVVELLDVIKNICLSRYCSPGVSDLHAMKSAGPMSEMAFNSGHSAFVSLGPRSGPEAGISAS